MTLTEITHEIGDLSLKSIAQDSDIKNLINRAQRSIAQRNNWSFLHNRLSVGVLSGDTGVDLPATFKQLSDEKSPVSYTDASLGQSNVPVKVASREEIESWWPWPWPFGPVLVPIPGSYLPIRVVFLEQNAGQWRLNIPPQFAATSILVFNISAYWYPKDLLLGTDRNALTDHGELAEALVNRAKAIAYFAEDPTDPRGMAAMNLYQASYRTALYADSAQKTGGRALHM